MIFPFQRHVILCSIIILSSANETFKEVFKARSGTYRSFYSVDYKFITLPKNIYELNISFKFIRWVGFVPLCPSSFNVTSVFQFGNFPLFKYDSVFQYNAGHVSRVDMFTPKAETRDNTVKAYRLKYPKPGTWLFGSIYENNDDYQHHVTCLADLQVTLIGFKMTPSVTVMTYPSGSSRLVSLSFLQPGSKLVEIVSTSPLKRLRLSHQCPTCTMGASWNRDSAPQMESGLTSKVVGQLYRYNDTMLLSYHVEMSTRLMIYLESFSHAPLLDVPLLIEYRSVRVGDTSLVLSPPTKIRGDTLFTYKFTNPDSESPKISISLNSKAVFILPFFIEPIKDQGSILTVEISSLSTNHTTDLSLLLVCISNVGLSTVNSLIAALSANSSMCRGHARLESLSRSRSGNGKVLKYRFFYPEWSWWYISMTMQADPTDSNQFGRVVNVSVLSNGCRHDSSWCNKHGMCLLTGLDTALVSSCHCFKPHYGLDCLQINPPMINKIRDSANRRNWLVFSNIAFIPAIIIAAVQRLFVLVLIYLVTAGFSMVYHMCYMEDSDLAYCALKVEELAYYDHLAAVISIWITMVSMSTLPHKIQNVLNVSMIFVCVVLADVIQKSMWFYCLPIATGILLLLLCWVYRMSQLKCIFPPIDWWILGLIPGLVTAAIGFTMFRFAIRHEYPYFSYHSMWHIFIALSICFVLPNTTRWKKALRQTRLVTVVTADNNKMMFLYDLLPINNQKWYEFKKNLNYYWHLDVILNPLLARSSKWSICKSY